MSYANFHFSAFLCFSSCGQLDSRIISVPVCMFVPPCEQFFQYLIFILFTKLRMEAGKMLHRELIKRIPTQSFSLRASYLYRLVNRIGLGGAARKTKHLYRRRDVMQPIYYSPKERMQLFSLDPCVCAWLPPACFSQHQIVLNSLRYLRRILKSALHRYKNQGRIQTRRRGRVP